MTRLVDVVLNDTWVERHSIPCIKECISDPTHRAVLLPLVSRAEEARKEADFISIIANGLESVSSSTDANESAKSEIGRTVECIISKILYLAEERERQHLPRAAFRNLAFATIAKGLLLIGEDVGYVLVKRQRF